MNARLIQSCVVLLALTGTSCLDDGGSPGPHTAFLWYANGGPAPSHSICPEEVAPPPFTCTYGFDIEDCQRQVQVFLDEWFRDLDVVFTVAQPPASPYLTLVITAGGATWCDATAAQSEGGIAPIACGRMLPAGTGYAMQCGDDPRLCAMIIAHEAGHLIGLEHTDDPLDIMYPYVTGAAERFQDLDMGIVNTVCNQERQNSYALLVDRLGSWPGGAKPDPFAGVQPESEIVGAFTCALGPQGSAPSRGDLAAALGLGAIVVSMWRRRRPEGGRAASGQRGASGAPSSRS